MFELDSAQELGYYQDKDKLSDSGEVSDFSQGDLSRYILPTSNRLKSKVKN